MPAAAKAGAVQAQSASDTVRIHRLRGGRMSQGDSVTVITLCEAEPAPAGSVVLRCYLADAGHGVP